MATIRGIVRLGVVLCAGVLSFNAAAQTAIEKNVVYGMYSGLALLMDVHRPDEPNGYGLIYINGSAWRAPLSLDSNALKDAMDRPEMGVTQLLEAGYTVFSINHRAAPRFPYPAAVADSQRAVRFIRHHADQFGIDAEMIGAVGGSSGGYLVSMLGALDGDENSDGITAIDQESAAVQAVIAIFPATDLVDFTRATRGSNALLTSYMAAYLSSTAPDGPPSEERKLFTEASPTAHITPDDPPFLLIHGDADVAVPYSQSEVLFARLQENNVTSEFITMPGGGHGAALLDGPNPPDHYTPMIDWLDRHLRQQR